MFRPSVRLSRHSRETGTRVGLLGPCFATATTKEPEKNSFFYDCLGAWDWWSGRGDAKFEELFITREDGHSIGLAGAPTNTDGKRHTIGD